MEAEADANDPGKMLAKLASSVSDIANEKKEQIQAEVVRKEIEKTTLAAAAIQRRAEEEAKLQADISSRAGIAGKEAEAARREKAAQQAEEKRLADAAVAARRSGLRRTAASDAMNAGGAVGAEEVTAEDSARVEAERQAVAAKKLQSRLKSLEKSISEKEEERTHLLQVHPPLTLTSYLVLISSS